MKFLFFTGKTKLLLPFLFLASIVFANTKAVQIDSLFKRIANTKTTLAEKIRVAEKAIKIAGNDTLLLTKSFSQMGSIQLTHSLYKGALLNFDKAISLAKRINNIELLSENYYLIGNTYMYLDELDQALSNYKKAEKLAKTENNYQLLGFIHNSKGIVFSKKNNLLKSYQAFRKSYRIFDKLKIEFALTYPLSNIGDYFLKIKEPDTAISYFKRTIELNTKFNDLKGNAISFGNIGLAYQQKGQYKVALEYFQQSLSIAEKNQHYKVIYDNYKDISDTYKLSKDFDKSLIYYEKYTHLKDSILNSETSKAIAEIEATYVSEKKEKEIMVGKSRIRELEYAEKINHFRIYLILSGLLVLAFISLFIVLRLKTTLKQRKLKEQLVKSELLIQQNESDRLENELENRNNDLTNFALDIARMNEFTLNIAEELKLFKAKKSMVDKDVIIQKLIFKTNNHLKLNEDFNHFQSNIEKVNDQFFKNLSTKFPALTTNEKHLCGLIRLNLTIKEIASIKNISPKSVEMNRYRLRKKLCLSKEDDLNQFMINM